jgi:predicted ATPase
MADRVGQQLGNYRLVSLLGQGGYAEVYLGQHVRFDMQAAVKVLHAHLTGKEAEHFQQEAETIAKLAHPSIVRVLDFDVQEGVPFLVMDYAPNGSLRRRHPAGEMVPLAQIVSYVKQVADALEYAHEHKVVHRDVKPENMLLGRREEVLLSDFGIATVAHSTGSLGVEAAVGTFAYMAPEQIQGHPRPASDQYALGVTVYEWLCGERPFSGSFTELVTQHLWESPPSLLGRAPVISPEVEQVVLRALAKDPKQRFATVAAFAGALEQASQHAPSYAGPLASGAPLPSMSAPSTYRTVAAPHRPAPLPMPRSRLIDRERELAKAKTLLQREDVGLVTLTGPGGIGKTRLVLQVATDLADRFADGVYFVFLAPVSSADFLVSTIANAIQFSFYGTIDPKMQLLTHLREKKILLVLDNFEHLLDGTELVVDIINQAPEIVVLITSRERLNIEGEWVIELPGLPLPRTGKKSRSKATYGAVQLFLDRAHQASTEPISEAELSSVVRICRLVEGMPLSIELAAAWRRVLSSEEIAREIEKSLAFLAMTSHGTLPRHRSMIAVFDPSWNLLSPAEQQVFRQLSVFRGGFRREAAERVVGATLTHLATLIDKSLLRRNSAGRFDMHELVRQYAAMKLEQAPGEKAAVLDRHCSFYAEMLSQIKGHLRSHLAGDALKEIRAEFENVRQSWQWAVTQRKVVEMKQSLQSLLDFYDTQGWFQEGEEAFGLAVEELSKIDQGSREWDIQYNIVLGQVLAGQGWLSLASGRYEKAVELSQASLDLLRQYEVREELMNPLITLGIVALIMGDYTRSQQFLQESLALQRAAGDQWGEGWSLGNLGIVAYMLGEYQKSYDLIFKALALFNELGDRRLIELCSSFLSMTMCALANYTEAERLARESVALSREISHHWGTALALCNLGVATYYSGRTVEAGQQLLEGVELFRMIGESWGIALALNYLANGYYTLGMYNEAERYALEALEVATKAKLTPLALESLVVLAALRVKEGEKESALELLHLALQHTGSTHETKEKARHQLAELEQNLTPEAMSDASLATSRFQEIVEKVLKAKQK